MTSARTSALRRTSPTPSFPGFTVTAEVDYAHQSVLNQARYGNWTSIPANKANAVGGIVRFQRSF